MSLKPMSLLPGTAMCNMVVELLSTRIIPDYDHNDFNILLVLVSFYGFIFLPQYVLNTNCEPEDDLK
jgi:hypothetical protein